MAMTPAEKAKLKKQLKPLGSLSDKAVKAAAKKAAKEVNPMKASARSHQKDLARMSGETAATKKFKADKKAGKMYKETGISPAYAAGKKAEKRTLKSFK